jgi:hypothetical protein
MKGIMTREYNKPRRNDARPPFRQQSSSGRYGEEQSPRPGRPRLNREIVDRAWEQGAQTQHADYHPRTNNGQGRQNWRSNQSEYSSYQNGAGADRPYGNRQRPYDNTRNRQDNYRRNGPAPQGYRGTPQPQQPSEQDRYQGRAPRNRTNEERPYQRYQDQRGMPNARSGYRSGPSRPYEGRAPREPRENAYRPPYEKRFEGDYEHFGYQNDRNPAPRSSERPQRGPRYNRNEPHQPTEERHVTRLPDGRVLKGPRPVQRKNAQFWTEIADDTEELMQQIPEPPAHDPVQEQAQADGTNGKRSSAREKKPRAAQNKDTTRKKKTPSEGQSSTGLKPSQRGFKWPTQ